jgi:hypothetical protein
MDVELRRTGGECQFSESTGSALRCRAEIRLNFSPEPPRA